MYHYYIQKNPPDILELANCKPIERYFYFASMEIAKEEERERLKAYGFQSFFNP